jgi:hypothetical protein
MRLWTPEREAIRRVLFCAWNHAKDVVGTVAGTSILGIVARRVYPDTPPRVVYSVTPLGETLRLLLDAMCKWGKSHSAAMALKKLEASEEEQ